MKKRDLRVSLFFMGPWLYLFAATHYQHNHDPMSLADLLGYSSWDTTRIYTAADDTEQLRQLEELGLVL